MQEKRYGKLRVKIANTRQEMGEIAALDAVEVLQNLLELKSEIHVMFAAAPSQLDFLQALIRADNIAWERVNVYHMDEYLGLEFGHEQSFGQYLKRHIFDHLTLKSINLINCSNAADEELERYGQVLLDNPMDIVFLGIGENAHIAFNDPPVANFQDPEPIKMIKLDEMSRQQQVNDKCFVHLEDVPTHALTVTIPPIINAKYKFCMVPGPTKADAVYNSLLGEISTETPASILREVDNTIMYLDLDSAAKILD